MKPPAFQFYADDFLGGTVDLSAEEVGAYIRLLCYQWGRGAIPMSIEVANRVAGCKVSMEVIAKFPDGKNKRMEAEREKQSEYRAKQSGNGKAGAVKRWYGGANGGANGETMATPMANGMANAWPEHSSPSPSPSPSPVSVTDSSKGGIPLEPSADPSSPEIAQDGGNLPFEVNAPTVEPKAACDGKESQDRPKVKRFTKPTEAEVMTQCAKIGLPDAEGAKFLSYYESNGWRVGRNPMKSWPHALQNWKNNHDSNHARNGRPSPLSPSASRNASIAGHDEWKRAADAADAAAALAGDQEAPW